LALIEIIGAKQLLELLPKAEDTSKEKILSGNATLSLI
jgi:hypothetical protein